MVDLKLVLLLFLSFAPDAIAAPSQVPMGVALNRPRKLQGRFLHITDIHPDPYYKPDASEKSACHRKKPKKATPRSGYYGLPYSGCDSPLTLTNYTLDYLEKEWSADIDFVVWTGDSARHDNDRKNPRTTNEIYMLNRIMAQKMEEVFLSKGIPVIPSIGNNDVWPHNIMLPGPNSVTSEFSSIWRSFVPFESFQVFQRGGYFSVEVIPNSLAVVSLNTMYFYDSNRAVGGCDPTDPEDPGNLQFDWLQVQLEIFRKRGVQVWLSGHVPPSADNFFPECYVRYAEVALRYQDTIVGHLYGHMNADHFFFIDAESIREERNSTPTRGDPHDEGRKGLYKTLLRVFEDIKTPHKISYDDYGVVNVSPSVVPNPYLPSFRIFTYNITGTPYIPADVRRAGTSIEAGSDSARSEDRQAVDSSACQERDSWSRTCRLWQPWHSSPDSPSRTNTLWSPLGYAQYYIPRSKLEAGDKKHAPKYKLEYLTYPVSVLHPPRVADTGTFLYPIPLRHLPKSLRNATITKSKYAPYSLADLTIPSWTDLARRLGDVTEKKLRKRFRRFMYMGGEEA
ncbi:uncharacterized protein LAESUDRAFT_13671 [Laetiporus sulphureus 93-53]|uniref:Endopolyphosphatase n=1 Tax=Laetiporus sulphureus 93-53 TaxID=1314785 RepID=A0A165I8S5_9APHY|nr:uncharacterized protein LAESUDRAFT_13671 [Laetiporus sulphureus 93-53]KZT12740.1 hypothetical protein LAESUDRAFT_13671 [Laetiporus sulphureus 93-53]